jgi:hypothetical protein
VTNFKLGRWGEGGGQGLLVHHGQATIQIRKGFSGRVLMLLTVTVTLIPNRNRKP